MTWRFERVAGPYEGPAGGMAWFGGDLLFSLVDEGRIMRFDLATGAVAEYRRYTNRVNGLAVGPGDRLFACQEGSRRVIEYLADGSATPLVTRLDGKLHNFPTDIVADRLGRLWFADPYNPQRAFGPQLFPPLAYASVLRMARNRASHQWEIVRVTTDTAAPRALALSPDETVLYLAEGGVDGAAPRELRAYPVLDEGVGPYRLLASFGGDHRGPQRGVEGMCLDATGNIVAVAGWRRSGPGPRVTVFTPEGLVIEEHIFPDDLPARVAFGGEALDSLFVTTLGGSLWRAEEIGRSGYSSAAPDSKQTRRLVDEGEENAAH